MRRILLLFLVLGATPAWSQSGVKSPQGWSLGLAAGGSAFSDFQRTDILATRTDATGAVQEKEYPRRVGAATTGRIAGILAYWPGSNWGVRLYGAYSPTRFQTVIPRSAAEFTGAARSSSDSIPLAPLRIVSYQLQGVFRLPTIRRTVPYGIAGGGITQYIVPHSGQPVPEEVKGHLDQGSRTQAAATFGVGSLLQARRRGWALHFELLDQISRTPVQSGPVHIVNTVSFTVGLGVQLNPQ